MEATTPISATLDALFKRAEEYINGSDAREHRFKAPIDPQRPQVILVWTPPAGPGSLGYLSVAVGKADVRLRRASLEARSQAAMVLPQFLKALKAAAAERDLDLNAAVADAHAYLDTLEV